MSGTQLHADHEGEVTVANIGRAYETIDDRALEEVSKFLLGLTEGTNGMRLVVDLSHTEFFGSAFLGILFRVWNRVTTSGGIFALCSLRSHCQEVIRTARLDTLWPIYSTREEAVRGSAPGPGS